MGLNRIFTFFVDVWGRHMLICRVNGGQKRQTASRDHVLMSGSDAVDSGVVV